MNDDLNRIRQSLKGFTEGVKNKQNEKDRQSFVNSISQEVVRIFTPLFREISNTARMNKEDMKQVGESIASRINIPEIRVPDVHVPPFPEIRVPEPRVTVNVPPISVPEIRMPKEMDIKGWVSLMGVDLNNPLPVQLRDADGKPVRLFENLTQLVNNSGGGGGFRRVRIDNPSTEPVNVTVVSGAGATSAVNISDSGGVGYSGSNPFPVYITSGGSATSATNIVDSSGVAYSGSNPVPVVFGASATQAVNFVDSSGVAYSGSNPAPVTGTVVVSSITATTAASIVDSNGIQYSGSNPVPISGSISGTVTVGSITASTAASLVDSSGVQYSGSNPVPITWVSGAGVSTAVHITDSGGVAYSGSNPVPITLVSGALTSTIVVGSVVGDAIDDGSAPVQTGGIARTANPTAVSANDVVKSTYDDVGRQLTRPVQVRDLTVTAYTSISNGTETTLLAASAGSFHDLMYIMLANSSNAAVLVDIRPVTAGNIIATIAVPADGTAGVSMGGMPIPQSGSDTGNNWTIDMPDITGTTVYATALFSREV